MNDKKPTIQDIVKYALDHDLIDFHRLNQKQKNVIDDICKCRTEKAGCNVDACCTCGYKRIHYNSCRNPSCPMCQRMKCEEWVDKNDYYTLNITYYHVVFTIPSELNPYFLRDQKFSYNCLFKAVSRTLTSLAKDPKYLGGKIGITAVLHTWSSTLGFHPHIHCIVSGGGVNESEEWISKDRFLFPVQVLSKLFRGKFLNLFRKKYPREVLEDTKEFDDVISACYQKDWVVYTKEPFRNPDAVLRYLGRYTHKIAISNGRIVSFEDGNVTFKYKDYANGSVIKEMTLSAKEFVRRFLMHVPPERFTRIRYYGFMGNAKRVERFKRLREITNTPAKGEYVRDKWKILKKLIGRDPRYCPKCNSLLTVTKCVIVSVPLEELRLE
ncbi:MAG: IS91 family transposase [Succinivibrionaceae bacterium]